MPQAPAAASVDKPSLIGSSPMASSLSGSAVAPLRMLDALGSTKGAQARRPTARPGPWLLLLSLSLVIATTFWWWMRAGGDALPMHRGDAGTPRLGVPAQIPVVLSSMAASRAVAVAEAAAGPARIERSGEADPVAARPLAQADGKPRAGTAVPAPASAVRPAVIAAKRGAAMLSTSAVATVAPKTVRPRPTAARTTGFAAAPSASGSPVVPHGDPDVRLLSAMLARLSGDADATAAPSRPTISQLAQRCEARATKAFECKRRVCAGYWGKADACPMSLAPKKS